MGGLGNQLFQYAAARALAIKHHTDVKVDLSFLNDNNSHLHTPRELELHQFNANFQIATPSDLKQFSTGSLFKKLIRKLSPLNALLPYTAIEKGFEFNKDYLYYPKNTYLQGFWQSEKYFSTIRPLLLKELLLKNELPQKISETAKAILASNAISLHVRRGDYVSNKQAQDFHGNLGLDYYERSLNYLTDFVKDPVVYCFSDDIEWLKAKLKLPVKCVYIDFTANEPAVYDLYLMSLCKHNIIANSSFSWWAAWLNQHPDKTVVAPKNWFASDSLNTKDLLPAEWIKL